MATVQTQELKVFYCYAREDQELRQKLEQHMANLKRLYHLKTWFDREILPGEDWETVIEDNLKSADLILLLVSPAFMASDYCYNTEMQHALQRHDKGEASVIPILLRRVHWTDAPFSSIQVLPTDALPITRWPDRDEAFYNVVVGIELVIKRLLAAHQTQTARKVKPAKQPAPVPGKTKEEGLKEGDALRESKRYKEAIVAYDHVIGLDPNSAKAYYGKGYALDELKRYEDALLAYEQAIRCDPNFADTYYDKGNTLYRLTRYQDALLAYEQAIRCDPNFVDAYSGKGSALDGLTRYEDALLAFEQAIRCDPNDAITYNNKGCALYRLTRYKDALLAFEQAIRCDPNFAIAYNNKGLALDKLGRQIAAELARKKAHELGYN